MEEEREVEGAEGPQGEVRGLETKRWASKRSSGAA